jgi:hypothetical protein
MEPTYFGGMVRGFYLTQGRELKGNLFMPALPLPLSPAFLFLIFMETIV